MWRPLCTSVGLEIGRRCTQIAFEFIGYCMHIALNIKVVFNENGRFKWPKNGRFWPKMDLKSWNKYIHTIPECAGVIDIYFIKVGYELCIKKNV